MNPDRTRLTTFTDSGMKAVIFDVDGTLVDSERDGHRVAFNQAFAEAGMSDHWDVATYGDLLTVTGGRRRLVSYLATRGHGEAEAADAAASLHARKTDIMQDLINQDVVPLRPGVADFVEALEETGVALYVATTGSRAWVEPLLERHFGPDRFAGIVTGTEITRLKPDPAVYLEVLRIAGVPAAECLAIEDSGPGVTAAVAAGLDCWAITNDYTHDHDVSAASYITSTFLGLRPTVGPTQPATSRAI